MNEQIADLILLLLIFGGVIVSWIGLWALGKLAAMDSELRLKLIVKDSGRIRLDEFTVSNGVHVAVARWYLTRKAYQLNGVREVDELGDEVFLFGEAKRKYLQEHLD